MTNFVELNATELETIDGGSPVWWVLMGAAIAVAAACNTVFDLGKNVGSTVYYLTH